MSMLSIDSGVGAMKFSSSPAQEDASQRTSTTDEVIKEVPFNYNCINNIIKK